MAKQKFTLKQWRQIRGMSQTELGDIVGVTRQTIAIWETSDLPADAETRAKLEQALNIKWNTDVCMP